MCPSSEAQTSTAQQLQALQALQSQLTSAQTTLNQALAQAQAAQAVLNSISKIIKFPIKILYTNNKIDF